MTEKPFVHKSAFCDFTTNFIFHEDLAEILIKILDMVMIQKIHLEHEQFLFIKQVLTFSMILITRLICFLYWLIY